MMISMVMNNPETDWQLLLSDLLLTVVGQAALRCLCCLCWVLVFVFVFHDHAFWFQRFAFSFITITIPVSVHLSNSLHMDVNNNIMVKGSLLCVYWQRIAIGSAWYNCLPPIGADFLPSFSKHSSHRVNVWLKKNQRYCKSTFEETQFKFG